MDSEAASYVQDLEGLISQTQVLQQDDSLPPDQKQQQLSKLTDSASAVLAKSPDNPAVLSAAARFSLQSGDYASAATRATQSLDRAPGDPQALVTRALAYYGSCDFPKARSDAFAALKASPGDPVATAVFKLAKRPVGCGEMEGDAAALHADQVGDLVRLSSQKFTREGYVEFAARLDRADKELMAKEYAKAYRDATWALLEFPDNPRALMQRVQAAMGLKLFSEAAADATRGLKLRPDAWQFMGARAKARQEGGRFRDAAADAERALALNTEDAEAWLIRGLARRKLGDSPSQYLEDFKKAAELDPHYRVVYEEAIIAARTRGPSLWRLQTAIDSIRGIVWLGALGVLFLSLAVILMALTFLDRKAGEAKIFAGTVPEGAAKVSADSYQIGEEIGRGGMGTVYQGFDQNLNRKVAIKELQHALREDEKERERFLEEARLVASLTHPNIVSIYAVVRERMRVLLIFEFVEGKTLQQLLSDSPEHRLPPTVVASVVKQVCAALEYAHGQRIIHRDLKPSNIMMDLAGTVKVMDFGIARRAKDSLRSHTGSVVGTPAYMAPEVLEGKVGPEADIYSLGVTVFEMMTGEPPSPEKLATLPRAQEEFFRRALERSPAARIHTPAEFRGAFLAVLAETTG